jgi:hypothetical protein
MHSNEGRHNLTHEHTEFRILKARRIRSASLRMGEKSRRILVGKAEGRRSLGISGRRWKGDIKMDRNNTRWYSVERHSLVGEQWLDFLNKVTYLRVPEYVEKMEFVSLVVMALGYKPEDSGFDTR